MLSVIIPTFNSERLLVPTLAMMVPGAMSGLVREVTLADGGSTDGTLEIADVAGCNAMSSSEPLAARLRATAAAARSAWYLFLRPGTVLDATWLDETARVIEEAERNRAAEVAVFRRSVSARTAYPAAAEALALLSFAVFGKVHPDQGLVISAALYDKLGGHPDGADPESGLLARIGRKHLLMLRSGARNSR